MPQSSIPKPPPGFVPESSIPKPPPGFVPEAQATAPVKTTPDLWGQYVAGPAEHPERMEDYRVKRDPYGAETVNVPFGGQVTEFNVISKDVDDDYFIIGNLKDYYAIRTRHIPNLIKALKKYQELYGEE